MSVREWNTPRTFHGAMKVLHSTDKWDFTPVFLNDNVLFPKSPTDHTKYGINVITLLDVAKDPYTLRQDSFLFCKNFWIPWTRLSACLSGDCITHIRQFPWTSNASVLDRTKVFFRTVTKCILKMYAIPCPSNLLSVINSHVAAPKISIYSKWKRFLKIPLNW